MLSEDGKATGLSSAEGEGRIGISAETAIRQE